MDPALCELLLGDGGRVDDEVEAIIRYRGAPVDVPGVRVVSRFGRIATCRLATESVVRVRHASAVASLKARRILGEECQPDGRGEAGPGAGGERRPRHTSLTGAGVVVGVVDWGCDFGHPNFRHVDGSSRLRALWDQRGPQTAGSPQPYRYGVVHRQRDIDEALAAADPYNALGYHPADADRDGSGAHGTHVMDIAAGNGAAGGPCGVAPDAELIFVHLADRDTGGLANLGDSVRILEAVDFVRRAAGRRPWVINLSVGRHGGPHDGRTLIELALDALMREAPGRFIVQSAGNYFTRSIHASGRLRPGRPRVLTLVTDAADVTPNELEVWYSGRDELIVQVGTPTGQRSVDVPLGARTELRDGDRTVGRIYHRDHDPNNDDHHVEIFLYPWAPAGRWTVRLSPVVIRDGTFHAWVERDEFCGGCQARFVPGDADGRSTTGTIANGSEPLVVGAYDPNSPTRDIASFSSAGPTRDGRLKPDLVAPGLGILAARSAPRGSPPAGLLSRKTGTSMAAPHVTGAVALCLQAAGPVAAADVRRLVLRSVRPPGDGSLGRSGHGYLDVDRLAAFATAATPHRPITRSKGTQMDPDRLYRELVYRHTEAIPAWIDASFVVLAGPGDRPPALADGDLMLRVRLGELGAAHVAVLSDAALTRWEALPLTGQTFEREGPGLYGPVVEGGAVPHTRVERFSRRVLDDAGRVPPGQVLLRPRSAAAPDGEAESPPAAAPRGTRVTRDLGAAVPPFIPAVRERTEPILLTPARSAAAITWTTGMHAGRSGVSADDIRAALADYVDSAAVAVAIERYNAAHPAAPIVPGKQPVDAVLVESVHQFQQKCYVDPSEHDGRAGESTLDSLGLIARTGAALRRADRANPRAQGRLNARHEQVRAATAGEFTAENWFDHMADPSFLGQRSRHGHGFHVVLVRRLRQAERYLLTRPAYQGKTPVELGRILGITERHAGARPTMPKDGGMHSFGLAIDIGYAANPWIRRPKSWLAVRRAASLISGTELTDTTASRYFHKLGSDRTLGTSEVWDAVRQRSEDLVAYFRLLTDGPALVALLTARGEPLPRAEQRWRADIGQDLTALTGSGDFAGHRPPVSGFMHLHRDLVLALRDHGCLAWGAVDLGPGRDEDDPSRGSGDMMHFDVRLGGVGAVLSGGHVPNAGHPCLPRPAVPGGWVLGGGGPVEPMVAEDEADVAPLHAQALEVLTEWLRILADVLSAATNPNALRDVAGLTGTQANARAGLQAAAELAASFGAQAAALRLAEMAAKAQATQTTDQKRASLKKAEEDQQLVTPEKAQQHAGEVLGELHTRSATPSPHEDPGIAEAIRTAAAAPGPGQIEATTADGQAPMTWASAKPAPLAQRCGFLSLNQTVLDQATVRDAIVEAAVAEQDLWRSGGTLQQENSNDQFSNLVRYWLHARQQIPFANLMVIATRATDPATSYGQLLGPANVSATDIDREARQVAPNLVVGVPLPDTPPNLEQLVVQALLDSRRSRLDSIPWSGAFVNTCVRTAEFNLNLEPTITGGYEPLLALSRYGRHWEYTLAAHRRRFGCRQPDGTFDARCQRDGTYHAFATGELAVQIGDIVVQDRQASRPKEVWTFAHIPFLEQRRELHGDIVVDVKPGFAETIGGNVDHSARRRRCRLDPNGRLVVATNQLYVQENNAGVMPALPSTSGAALDRHSTRQIFALLSLVEACVT